MEKNIDVCGITFNEKVGMFSHDYLKCCKYISSFGNSQHIFTKNLYSKLISTSQLLEDFLDFHGAKNNKEQYFYRELSATIRHLSISSYSQKHISNRLIFYNLKDTDEFEKEGTATLDFLKKTLLKLTPVILEEAKRLNILIPEDHFTEADFPGVVTSEMLEYDIDDIDRDLQKKNIVKIARVVKIFFITQLCLSMVLSF